MYATERQQEILTRARSAGRVEVRSLAKLLDVTQETVRRDLTALERRGLLHRVHGGAIPMERLGFELAVPEREAVMAAEKERIARAALDEVPDGGAIILDAGTTTARLAALLPVDSRLTVVTHALPIAVALANHPAITVHLLGGTIRRSTLAAVGHWAERDVRDIYADVAFIGTNGLTVNQGLTTPDLAEAAVKQALIAAARRTVVLADHTKIGRTDFGHVAALADVDTIITDTGVSADVAAELEAAGPRVFLA